MSPSTRVVYEFRYMTTLLRELEAALDELVREFGSGGLSVRQLYYHCFDLIVSPCLFCLGISV